MSEETKGTTPSQAPMMSREECLLRLQVETGYSEDLSDLLDKAIDAIMSLQAEVERMKDIAGQAEKEAPIFDALMIELRGSWPQYQHYADLLNEARGFEKVRQPK